MGEKMKRGRKQCVREEEKGCREKERGGSQTEGCATTLPSCLYP